MARNKLIKIRVIASDDQIERAVNKLVDWIEKGGMEIIEESRELDVQPPDDKLKKVYLTVIPNGVLQ